MQPAIGALSAGLASAPLNAAHSLGWLALRCDFHDTQAVLDKFGSAGVRGAGALLGAVIVVKMCRRATTAAELKKVWGKAKAALGALVEADGASPAESVY